MLASCCLAPAALAAGAGPSAELDRVLKHLPDDAGLVLVIPDLDGLAAGIAAFARAIDADELATIDGPRLTGRLYHSPVFGQVLSQPETVRALALAFSPRYSAPVAVFAVGSATARSAFERRWQAEQSARPDNPRELARIADGVVITGKDRQVVAAAAKGSGRLAARMGKHLAAFGQDKAALLWVDVPVFARRLGRAIAIGRQFVHMGLAAAGPDTQAARAVTRSLSDACQTLVNEALVYSAALRIGADGIFASDRATFSADGKVCGYLKQVRRAPGDPLRGLPNRPAAMVLASEWLLPAERQTLNQALFAALLATLPPATQPAEQARRARLRQAVAAYRHLSGYNAALSLPAGQTGMCCCGLYMTDKPKLLSEEMATLTSFSAGLMNTVGAGISLKLTSRPVRLGTARVDAYSFRFRTADPPAQAMLEALYGQDPTLYLAPRPEGILYALGPAEPARERLGQMLAGAAGRLADDASVAAALRAIAPRPQFCLLLDPAPLLRWTMDLGRITGAPLPQIDLPQRSAYLAFGLYLEPRALRAELWVPAEPIATLREAFEAARQHVSQEPT